ncbi:MAG: hypothetical protein KAX40_10200 [Herpetosiphon sp.]|nr:hypothetical protein [Herpetosiphon sp.]
MKRALVILNPMAGNSHQRRAVAQGIAEWRSRHGWHVQLRETRRAGDATEIAQTEHGQYDLVVAAGGDGTVNEVMNGLVETDTALAALPIGTGNVWVRELQQSVNPLTAARQLVDGRVQRIDVGKANSRYFLLMAGIGLDAAITKMYALAIKNAWDAWHTSSKVCQCCGNYAARARGLALMVRRSKVTRCLC